MGDEENYFRFEHSWSDYIFDYILKSFKLKEVISHCQIICDDSVSSETRSYLTQRLKNRVNIDGGITLRGIERILNAVTSLTINVEKTKAIKDVSWDDYTKWKDLRLVNITFHLSEQH